METAQSTNVVVNADERNTIPLANVIQHQTCRLFRDMKNITEGTEDSTANKNGEVANGFSYSDLEVECRFGRFRQASNGDPSASVHSPRIDGFRTSYHTPVHGASQDSHMWLLCNDRNKRHGVVFEATVTCTEFLRVKEYVKNCTDAEHTTSITTDYNYPRSVRITEDHLSGSILQQEKCKKKSHNMDIYLPHCTFDIRFALASERKISSNLQALPAGVEHVRLKERDSFVVPSISDVIRIDFTRVRSGRGHIAASTLQGAVEQWKCTPEDQRQLLDRGLPLVSRQGITTTYEIELEILWAKLLGDTNTIPTGSKKLETAKSPSSKEGSLEERVQWACEELVKVLDWLSTPFDCLSLKRTTRDSS